MQKKIENFFFGFEIIAFELVALNTRFYWQNILVIGRQYANKDSEDFKHFEKRVFGDDFLSEWSKNITKILLCGFKQCVLPFNMLTVHKCSDTMAFWVFKELRFFQSVI